MRASGLVLIVNSRVEHPQDATGYDQSGGKGRSPLIVIDNADEGGRRQTLWHELGPFIDTALARCEPGL